jgi:hypothetical protein
VNIVSSDDADVLSSWENSTGQYEQPIQMTRNEKKVFMFECAVRLSEATR